MEEKLANRQCARQAAESGTCIRRRATDRDSLSRLVRISIERAVPEWHADILRKSKAESLPATAPHGQDSNQTDTARSAQGDSSLFLPAAEWPRNDGSSPQTRGGDGRIRASAGGVARASRLNCITLTVHRVEEENTDVVKGGWRGIGPQMHSPGQGGGMEELKGVWLSCRAGQC